MLMSAQARAGRAPRRSSCALRRPSSRLGWYSTSLRDDLKVSQARTELSEPRLEEAGGALTLARPLSTSRAALARSADSTCRLRYSQYDREWLRAGASRSERAAATRLRAFSPAPAPFPPSPPSLTRHRQLPRTAHTQKDFHAVMSYTENPTKAPSPAVRPSLLLARPPRSRPSFAELLRPAHVGRLCSQEKDTSQAGHHHHHGKTDARTPPVRPPPLLARARGLSPTWARTCACRDSALTLPSYLTARSLSTAPPCTKKTPSPPRRRCACSPSSARFGSLVQRADPLSLSLAAQARRRPPLRRPARRAAPEGGQHPQGRASSPPSLSLALVPSSCAMSPSPSNARSTTRLKGSLAELLLTLLDLARAQPNSPADAKLNALDGSEALPHGGYLRGDL